MQLTSIFVAAVAVLAPAIEAQYARVVNNCGFNAWVQSVPYDPSSPSGPLTKLVPDAIYSEKFKPSGSTLKLATTRTLTTPLFGGYSLGTNPFDVYYELKDNFGNPFVQYPNSMGVNRPGCGAFHCPRGAHSPDCYSTGGSDAVVYACKRPTNVTVSLCSFKTL